MSTLALRTLSKRPAASLRPLQALVAQRGVSNTKLNNKPSLTHQTETSMSNVLPPPPPPKMSFQDIFAASQGEHQGVWKNLWDKGTYHYWDRGQVSPSLVDFLKDHPDLFQPTQTPLTALVPGCGRGHDVNLFADLGMQAYGLELASSATEIARDFSATIPPPPAPGSRNYITGDFFSNEWLNQLNTKQFDLVYDYTFMVALDPAKGLREQWAERVAGLIKSGGILICLEFPLYKAYDLPGPPWAIRSETYVGLLESVGFERVHHEKPRRYLPAGKDTDMISAWRRT
ncbi:hypothetical protein TWF481_008693 [Arthrobotrys musiformis]|uniref:S-adenosyl-L-methionine-dependent methyltransferase n=1 Tax=Arthrobotrys musiformis TaxID=47236 RepID=A0AAV9W7Y9_9PEZI